MRAGVAAVAVIMLGIGALAGYGLRARQAPPATEEEGEHELEVEPIDPAELSVPVATAAVERGRMPRVLAVLATIRPAPEAVRTVSSRAGGVVVEVFGRAPRTVKAGEPLLRFAPEPLAAEVAKALGDRAEAESAVAAFERGGRELQQDELEAAVKTCAAKVDLAAAEVARLEPLVAKGNVAEKTLAEAKVALDDAKLEHAVDDRRLALFTSGGADLEHARLVAARAAGDAALADAQARLDAAAVKAEADGTLLELAARVGDGFEPGAPLGRLLVSDERVAEIPLAPSDSRRVRVGMPLALVPGEGDALAGRIESIAAAVDSAGAVVVRAVLDGAAAARPGEVLAGEIELEALDGALLVPEAALVDGDEKTIVLAVDGEHVAHRVEVEVLARHRGRAAVAGALEAGARVIVDGAYALPDGAHVVEK